MYYNTQTSQLLVKCPLNGYLPDGTLVQGLNLADFETKKLCGILPVKSDTPSQPENTYEDVESRVIEVEEDGVVVVRTWVANEVVIPQFVSPLQIRLWLINNSISLSSVDNAINNLEDDIVRETTKAQWEYSTTIDRQHPLMDSLGSELGLTPEQIDNAFVEASLL